MKKVILFWAVISLTVPVALFAGGSGTEAGHAKMRTAGKPMAPLKISIAPVQAGLAAADIKPGDTVEFKITGVAFTDAAELGIIVELQGGVSLVSGDTSWTGPAKKGEDKMLLFTVRAPMHGNGIIVARISMSPSSGASFAAGAEYRFGRNAVKKPATLPEKKKDDKGREIREYRDN